MNDDGDTEDSPTGLSEETLGFDLNGDGDAEDTIAGAVSEANFQGLKAIVGAIATEIFDPPTSSGADDTNTGFSGATVADDNEFDPPYQSVGDWWEILDCRTMRLAVGEDNDYLVQDTDAGTEGNQTETSAGGFCGHLPGAAAATAANTLSQAAHNRVDVVGKALLARSEVGRPSFNVAVAGIPTISGTAQVGSTLTANTAASATATDWEQHSATSGYEAVLTSQAPLAARTR